MVFWQPVYFFWTKTPNFFFTQKPRTYETFRRNFEKEHLSRKSFLWTRSMQFRQPCRIKSEQGGEKLAKVQKRYLGKSFKASKKTSKFCSGQKKMFLRQHFVFLVQYFDIFDTELPRTVKIFRMFFQKEFVPHKCFLWTLRRPFRQNCRNFFALSVEESQLELQKC